MIIVVMGVAGCGKTYVGRALAEQLAWPFFDADDLHPAENIARMRGGIALTDGDREPWLLALRELLLRVQNERGSAVLACSSLRTLFRERLRADLDDVRFVYLKSEADLIAQRLALRTDHFMPAQLAGSQFEALEEPVDALVLDASQSLDALIAQIRKAFAP